MAEHRECRHCNTEQLIDLVLNSAHHRLRAAGALRAQQDRSRPRREAWRIRRARCALAAGPALDGVTVREKGKGWVGDATCYNVHYCQALAACSLEHEAPCLGAWLELLTSMPMHVHVHVHVRVPHDRCIVRATLLAVARCDASPLPWPHDIA